LKHFEKHGLDNQHSADPRKKTIQIFIEIAIIIAIETRHSMALGKKVTWENHHPNIDRNGPFEKPRSLK